MAEQRLKDTEAEIENHQLCAEVERLKAVEKVRDEERARSASWADDLRERFRMEKQVLEDKVASLEARLASATTASGMGSSDTAASSSVSSTASTVSPPAATASTVAGSGSSSTTAPTTALTSSSTSTVATSPTCSFSISTTDSTTTVMSIGSAEMIQQLFETQSQMFAAQMQAASLPPLCTFDGQSDGDDEEFDLWLERFEERAKLAKWTDETKLCQLRLHQAMSAETTPVKGGWTSFADAP